MLNDHQRALKNAAGILANQNTISTILKMLIPVKRPRVPPVFKKEKKYCFLHKSLICLFGLPNAANLSAKDNLLSLTVLMYLLDSSLTFTTAT